MTDQHESKIPRDNTREAIDDEAVFHGDLPRGEGITVHEHQLDPWPNSDPSRDPPSGFWPPRAVADLIEHALPDLRRARDRIQYVPHNQRIAKDIASLEELQMLLRTERHR